MDNILTFCAGLPEIDLNPGEAVIEEGEQYDRLLFLIEGSVLVSKAGIEIARVSEAGSVFGEISALLGMPASASVEALASVRFYVLDNAADRLSASPELALHTARILARRLVGATAYLADIKQQFADRTDHFGMVDQVLDRLLQQQGDWSGKVSDSPENRDPRL